MTVSTTYSPIVSPGNGTAAAITVTWPFFEDTDLVVTAIDADGVETIKTISVDYTVTGGADSDGLPAAGTVTPTATRASGTSWRIERSTPKTQVTTWDAFEKFPETSVEAAFDRLTLISQESGGAGIGTGITGDALMLDSSGATDVWDADSHPIRNVSDAVESSDAVNYGQFQQMQIDAGAGDVVGPASAVNLRIAVFDGVTGKILKDGGETVAALMSAIAGKEASLGFTPLNKAGDVATTLLGVKAAVAGNASFPIYDENDVLQGLVYWNRSLDSIVIVAYADDGTTATSYLVLGGDSSSFKFGTNTVWHEGNDGPGSTLDADTLDTYHATSFVRSINSVTPSSGDVQVSPNASGSGWPIGSYASCYNASGGSLSDGATVAGTSLKLLTSGGGALTGTWKNVHGAAVASTAVGYFVRTV